MGLVGPAGSKTKGMLVPLAQQATSLEFSTRAGSLVRELLGLSCFPTDGITLLCEAGWSWFSGSLQLT